MIEAGRYGRLPPRQDRSNELLVSPRRCFDHVRLALHAVEIRRAVGPHPCGMVARRSQPERENQTLRRLPVKIHTMKAVRKLVVLASVSLLPVVVAHPSISEQEYLESCRKD